MSGTRRPRRGAPAPARAGAGARRRRVTALGALSALVLAGLVAAVPGGGEDAYAGPRGSAGRAPDPATQPQTSLAAAAAAGAAPVRGGTAAKKPPTVPAARKESTKKLARSARSSPEDVLSPEAANGGCRLEYGRGGQCLPVVPPGAAAHAGHGTGVTWTCDLVRETFPDGIEVRGGGVGGAGDPLHLDTDHDGTGCGPGDR
ncbi:hypothetical protein WDZ17_12145 [Pseudokineococcus basanitobsidens]|uniref:Uncharacterized protein n=1 Tax=Pseudokineococcus basanitobsidens TaxID=1926649 RepID=A0ABU8RLT5_9ACTN